MEKDLHSGKEGDINRTVEVLIRVFILIFIFGWCFVILTPFFSSIFWGIIIAVAVYPVFKRLTRKLKGRSRLAAILITLVLLTILIIPAILLADSLWDGVSQFKALYQSGNLIPPPGEQVKSWPLILKPVSDLWLLASQNLQAAALKYGTELKSVGSFLLSLLAGIGLGLLQFVVSIIIAGVFLGYAKEGGIAIRSVFIRLGGERGAAFADLSEQTIRNVVKGVLGVAVIQTLLACIGFVVAGVPAAGLWTLICLILALVQVGAGPVVIPVSIYMFFKTDTLTASLLAGWTVFVAVSDNILKPILLGKGSQVPMLVVLLGSLGGFAANGFLGLFLGPVLLSLGYKLYQIWLDGDSPKTVSAENKG